MTQGNSGFIETNVDGYQGIIEFGNGDPSIEYLNQSRKLNTIKEATYGYFLQKYLSGMNKNRMVDRTVRNFSNYQALWFAWFKGILTVLILQWIFLKTILIIGISIIYVFLCRR